jgi:transposase-like protein
MEQATPSEPTPPPSELGAEWFDPLEDAVRVQVRAFIERLLEELDAALGRGRYARDRAAKGHRNGHRERRLNTTFGPLVLAVPRARLADDDVEVLARRKAFLAKWRLRCRPVATRLEEAGERLFTFVRYPPEQWRSLRTTDEIDKRFVAAGAMILAHGRPRGEERGGGWEPRRAA